MDKLPVADILELPVADRLRLMGVIWDSIAHVPEAVPVSEDLRADLAQRLAEFEADPDAALPWDEVRRRISQGTWRSP